MTLIATAISAAPAPLAIPSTTVWPSAFLSEISKCGVGYDVGKAVGASVLLLIAVGEGVGNGVGAFVGEGVGEGVGHFVGLGVGASVGANVVVTLGTGKFGKMVPQSSSHAHGIVGVQGAPGVVRRFI